MTNRCVRSTPPRRASSSRALIEGKLTPAEMANLSLLALRKKIPALTEALHGRVTDHHRFMLQRLLGQVENLEKEIASFDTRIAQATRRGVKRATMAVAHTLLCTSWQLLKDGSVYKDPGHDYFQKLHAD